MYRIKVNGNYNLVIADINVTLSASNKDGRVVEKELIDNSNDCKKLVESGLLIIEEVGKAESKKSVARKQEDTSFVAKGNDVNTKPNDVFVREPDYKETVKAKVEEVTLEDKIEEVIENPILVVDKEAPIKVDAEVEAEVNVSEEAVVKEEVEEEKPATRKVNKKNNKK